MSNIEKGKYGEYLACKFLEDKGYKIVETNYKYSRYGEIDIIALYKDILCFVEVKTRTSDRFGTPMEAITKEKLLKIRACMKNYALNTTIKHKRCRIDAISVELGSNEPKIAHIENIEF